MLGGIHEGTQDVQVKKLGNQNQSVTNKQTTTEHVIKTTDTENMNKATKPLV